MRVLLDECPPKRLRRELVDHEVKTAPEMSWASKRNGELLTLAAGQFDVFVTAHLKSPHVFVFVKGKKMAGRPISYMGYLHAFNDARDAAKARPDLIPHDCRRTAIDRMERFGTARSTAMIMVGDKTESVYRRYAITSPKTLEDAGSKPDAVKLPKA